MLKRTIIAATVAVLTLMSVSVVAPAANAAVSHAPATVSADASNSEYIAAINEVMPSLQDSYTNKQLIKLGKLICKSLKYNSVASVDKTVSKYVTDDEAMALVALATAAYCEEYWPKVSRFYDIT